MGSQIRFAAFVGGGAFAFSVLVGLLAGVSFASVVLRALASATVFGALAAAAAYFVPRLLPGLIDSDSNRPGQPIGGSVDIVVDDTSDDEDEATGDGSLVEEVVERSAPDANEVMNAVIEEERGGASVDINNEDLDQMPDIGSMAGSFVASTVEDDEQEGESSGDLGGFVPVGGDAAGPLTNDQGFEAETIAKAMRTMMSRDT